MKKCTVKKLSKLAYLDLCITLQEIIPGNFYVYNEERKCHERFDILKAEIKSDNFDKDVYEVNLLPLDKTEVYISMNNYNEAIRRIRTLRTVEQDTKKLLASEINVIKSLGSKELQDDIGKENKKLDLIDISREEVTSTLKEVDRHSETPVALQENVTLKKKMDETPAVMKESTTEEVENSGESKKGRRSKTGYKIPLTVENFTEYYVNQNLSATQCSEIMGIPKGTLMKFASDHNIKKGRGKGNNSRERSDTKEGDIGRNNKQDDIQPLRQGSFGNEHITNECPPRKSSESTLTHRDSEGKISVISGSYQRGIPAEDSEYISDRFNSTGNNISRNTEN